MTPKYRIVILNDNGTYGNITTSKDVIFDESSNIDPDFIACPPDDAFLAIPNVPLENILHHDAPVDAPMLPNDAPPIEFIRDFAPDGLPEYNELPEYVPANDARIQPNEDGNIH